MYKLNKVHWLCIKYLTVNANILYGMFAIFLEQSYNVVYINRSLAKTLFPFSATISTQLIFFLVQ